MGHGLLRRSLTCLGLLLLAAAPAAGQRTLVIERFEATIDVARDGTVEVEETIVPRFTGSWNGIFRTIPIQYRTPQGMNYTLRLAVVSATDDEGHALKFESSRERHYLKLKIWVPGATDTTKTVKLRYRVANGLRFFEEHDELYWNVTGDEWDVPIEAASALVRLPDDVTGVRATAFKGAYGSTDQAKTEIGPSGVHIAAADGLGFREGLTAVVGWNPGVVHRPTAVERTAGTVYSNLPLAIPPVVLLGMWRLWRSRGRDPERLPIAAQYAPPDGLTPAEIGTLVDGRPDMRDITATIVDLAVRGCLHITETKEERFLGLFSSTDYTFKLQKSEGDWNTLKQFEVDMLKGMFGSGTEVTLSALKNKFYKHLPGLKNDLYGMLVREGHYSGRPDRVRLVYVILGVVIGVLIAILGGSLMGAWGMQPAAGVAAGIISGGIIAVFGWFMPARTIRGARELEKVLGFQEFLSRVEGERLERMVKTPELFEKYLPFAMALGVEANWSKAFEGIFTEPPRWYTGTGGIHTFHPSSFTSNLSAMSAVAASTMASAPRSSGGSGFSGGSSGGGFGGGGGGGF